MFSPETVSRDERRNWWIPGFNTTALDDHAENEDWTEQNPRRIRELEPACTGMAGGEKGVGVVVAGIVHEGTRLAAATNQIRIVLSGMRSGERIGVWKLMEANYKGMVGRWGKRREGDSPTRIVESGGGCVSGSRYGLMRSARKSEERCIRWSGKFLQ